MTSDLYVLAIYLKRRKYWLYVLLMSRTRFRANSTLYSCLNVKELLARSRRKIRSLSDCNWTRAQNHLVRKRALNHLAKLTNGWVFVYELSGSAFQSSYSHLMKILLEGNIVIIKSRTKFYVIYTTFFFSRVFLDFFFCVSFFQPEAGT